MFKSFIFLVTLQDEQLQAQIHNTNNTSNVGGRYPVNLPLKLPIEDEITIHGGLSNYQRMFGENPLLLHHLYPEFAPEFNECDYDDDDVNVCYNTDADQNFALVKRQRLPHILFSENNLGSVFVENDSESAVLSSNVTGNVEGESQGRMDVGADDDQTSAAGKIEDVIAEDITKLIVSTGAAQKSTPFVPELDNKMDVVVDDDQTDAGDDIINTEVPFDLEIFFLKFILFLTRTRIILKDRRIMYV
jgi:hypothetical protein